MDMFRLNCQNDNFYSVFRRCSSDASADKIAIFLFSKHFVPVLWAPLKMPDRDTDAVRPPFIFIFFIAHAKIYLHFHFISTRSALSRSAKFIRTRKYSLALMVQWATIKLTVHNHFRNKYLASKPLHLKRWRYLFNYNCKRYNLNLRRSIFVV